ncbi:MAG: hypothetical protein QOE38_2464, partial [Thermoleophilaceae bacterium]|nr:hypothetical protein [Thermoleophilaceae bacterium]
MPPAPEPEPEPEPAEGERDELEPLEPEPLEPEPEPPEPDPELFEAEPPPVADPPPPVPGTEGTDDVEGTEGADGTEGVDGTEGAVGTEGVDGTEGAVGTEGVEGTDGTDGAEGTLGVEGTDGTETASVTPAADNFAGGCRAGADGTLGADVPSSIPSARPTPPVSATTTIVAIKPKRSAVRRIPCLNVSLRGPSRGPRLFPMRTGFKRSGMGGSTRPVDLDSAPMAEMRAGAEFAGYQIEGLAGRGGMGVVYKAMDVRLGRPVAIKLIAPHLSGDPMFRVRFEREARLAAMIRHPSVITVYGAGEQEGQLYVVMEYIAGTDLRATIDEEGKLDPARAAGIIHQVAGALDAAHARALVHRDVKPANVLIAALDGREEAYLTDFGLTKHTASDSGLTGTGMFVGTLDYVAPEQIAGEQVDARTDVYSLGCVLYHALTGQVPFPRSNQLATLYAHAHEPPPDIRAVRPDLNGALADVVATALAKEPADRYPAAGDMGQAALSAAVQAETVAPPPPRPPPLQATRIRQRERIASIKVAAPPEGLYAEGGTVWVALPEEDR